MDLFDKIKSKFKNQSDELVVSRVDSRGVEHFEDNTADDENRLGLEGKCQKQNQPMPFEEFMRHHTPFQDSQFRLLINFLKENAKRKARENTSSLGAIIIVSLFVVVIVGKAGMLLFSPNTYYFFICVQILPFLNVCVLAQMFYYLFIAGKWERAKKAGLLKDYCNYEVKEIVTCLAVVLRDNAKSLIPQKLDFLIEFIKKNMDSEEDRAECYDTLLRVLEKDNETFNLRVSPYSNYYHKFSKMLKRAKRGLDKDQLNKFAFLLLTMGDTEYWNNSQKVLHDKTSLVHDLSIILPTSNSKLAIVRSFERGEEAKWYKAALGDSDVAQFVNVKSETGNETKRLVNIKKPMAKLKLCAFCILSIWLTFLLQQHGAGFLFVAELLSFLPLFISGEYSLGDILTVDEKLRFLFYKIFTVSSAVVLPFMMLNFLHAKAEETFDCDAEDLSEYVLTGKSSQLSFSPEDKKTYQTIDNLYRWMPDFMK